MIPEEIYWAIHLPTGKAYLYGVKFVPVTTRFLYPRIKYGELTANSPKFNTRPKTAIAHRHISNDLYSHLQNALGADFKVLKQNEVREWVAMWAKEV